MKASARYAFRCFLTGVSAFCASILTAVPGVTWDDAITAVCIAVPIALAYAGIGAASQNVEPNVGNKRP